MTAFLLICFAAVASAQHNYDVADINNNNNNVELAQSNSYSSPVSFQAAEDEYNKAFYTYSTPEEEFDNSHTNQQVANVMKKNLRVIFIKGPENNALENIAFQMAKNLANDRAAIYVLSKQPDFSSLVNQMQQHISDNPIKPEVHFVKYRTQAEAENAQRLIQAQYDSLPGTSSSNNPSVASVLNFASNASPFAFSNAEPNAEVVTTTAAPTRNTIPSRNPYLSPRRKY